MPRARTNLAISRTMNTRDKIRAPASKTFVAASRQDRSGSHASHPAEALIPSVEQPGRFQDAGQDQGLAGAALPRLVLQQQPGEHERRGRGQIGKRQDGIGAPQG
jgi:hypothetical protein